MIYYTADIDSQLVDRIRKGDEEALAASVIHDTEDAKDIVNDLFVSL